MPIRNVNRVVGTITGSEITRSWGAQGLPEDTVQLHFKGSAGQSFGAFMPPGMTFRLEGDANDYVGKGLSGGKIIVYPVAGGDVRRRRRTSSSATWRSTARRAARSTSAAWPASASACATAASRRSSSRVGDHGCEYMTGGRVVVLGPAGRNFAAGMSGGVAYVLDEPGTSPTRVNRQMVGIEKLESPEEIAEVRALVERHLAYTKSARAKRVLDAWDQMVPKFVKVMPNDYKRMLTCIARAHGQGLTGDEAVMAAFEENARDLSRVGGN